MTTAHRPTFDHLKGKANQNKTHIVHKKLLPQHSEIKYRHAVISEQDDEYVTGDIDLDKLKKSVEELKLELLEREREKSGEDVTLDVKLIEGEKQGVIEGDHEAVSAAEDEEDLSESAGSGVSSDESEDESEDEDELLLRELEKIKKERAEKAKNDKINELIKKTQDEEEAKLKRSWRDETVFSNRRSKRNKTSSANNGDDKNNYVNDMLRDEKHKLFMDRYIK